MKTKQKIKYSRSRKIKVKKKAIDLSDLLAKRMHYTVIPLCEFCGRKLQKDDFYLVLSPKRAWFFCSRSCLKEWRG